MIIISDGRGTLEIEPYIDDDGGGVMISHTARPTPTHLALDADEARNLAAMLIKFADEQDAARKAQPQQQNT